MVVKGEMMFFILCGGLNVHDAHYKPLAYLTKSKM